MTTILSCTNRPDSYTETVARLYAELMTNHSEQAHVLSLRELPVNVAFEEVFGKRSPAMQELIDTYLVPVHKFVFVVPEYNGSFPGILKVFIDAIPTKTWRDKKAAIVGVSSGRAGNLRGQEQLTGILHYVKMHVHYNKPKLSGIEGLMDDNRHIIDGITMKILEDHVDAFIKW